MHCDHEYTSCSYLQSLSCIANMNTSCSYCNTHPTPTRPNTTHTPVCTKAITYHSILMKACRCAFNLWWWSWRVSAILRKSDCAQQLVIGRHPRDRSNGRRPVYRMRQPWLGQLQAHGNVPRYDVQTMSLMISSWYWRSAWYDVIYDPFYPIWSRIGWSNNHRSRNRLPILSVINTLLIELIRFVCNFPWRGVLGDNGTYCNMTSFVMTSVMTSVQTCSITLLGRGMISALSGPNPITTSHCRVALTWCTYRPQFVQA